MKIAAAMLFTFAISLPLVQIEKMEKPESKAPEIKVPYDISVVENTQKSVDEGHSPWNLDPIFVAQVFASLQLSPEGIID
jgi:hypothetical protein